MLSLSLDNARALIWLVRRFIGPYLKFTVVLVLLSIVSASLASLQPLVLAPAMDATLLAHTAVAHTWRELTLNNLGATMLALLGLGGKSHAFALIVFTAVAYIVIAGVSSLLQYASYLLSAWVASSAHRDLQVALSGRMITLSLSFFVRQRTGDLISRVTNDTSEVINSLDLSLRKMLQSGVQIAVYALLLFRTDQRLAFATVGLSVLHLVVTRVLRDRMRKHTSDRFDALADVSSRLQETVLGIRIVKSFAAELFEIRRFAQAAREYQRRTLKLAVPKHAEEPMRATADAVAIGGVLTLAFLSLQTGRLNTTGFVLFVFLARQTIAPASLFAQSILGLQVGLGSARRVLEILNEQPTLVDGTAHPEGLKRSLKLDHVGFAYDTDRPVLHDVDLEVHKRELVALVGPSGAGKSTLSDLVLRLYDPTEGRVLLDGVDVRTYRQADYRRLFGVVSQECLLFNGTVRENIAYGVDHSDEEAVRRAAQIANAEEFILALPYGLDTMVGDRGIRLSGGQRQRIAIARAVYHKPEILILDEATSSLDTDSEQQVQAAIERILENMTAIVIAHRLSTVRKADRIVVLNNGRIEASGPHETLLSTSATYRRLYELQFGAITTSPNDADTAANDIALAGELA